MTDCMLTVYTEQGANKDVAESIIADAKARDENTPMPPMPNAGNLPSPASFESHRDFLDFFLNNMQDFAFVDIGDFEIFERRQRFSRPLLHLKKTIWKLLKFYTYRLWSQQNEVNGFMLTALNAIDDAHQEQIQILEKRIQALEEKQGNITR